MSSDSTNQPVAASVVSSHEDVAGASATPAYRHAIKETVTAVIIAFTLAFVFRGFVMEAFLIPTGSMAPTLRGAHMQFVSPKTGYTWATAPRDLLDDGITPQKLQGSQLYEHGDPKLPIGMYPPIEVRDPMSGWPIREKDVQTRWGDRIFVMKYLYSIFEPARWDVVVFKNPRDPTVNYIKRLIGLPGEMVAIIDGDVFVRTPDAGEQTSDNPWTLAGWHIVRKTERAQLAMWQPLFTSAMTPESATLGLERWFVSPWMGVGNGPTGKAWQIENRREYEYTGTEPTKLEWDARRRPINDAYAYNESLSLANGEYPVSDLRLSLAITPHGPGRTCAAVVRSRGHEFRTVLGAGPARLEMREKTEGGWGDWTQVAASSRTIELVPDRATAIDFWHVDQSMQLRVNGERVCEYDYEWSPRERVKWSLGMSLEDVAAGPQSLTYAEHYCKPEARFEFTGGSFAVANVALSRDIHYQADMYRSENEQRQYHSMAHHPALATHPASTLRLAGDQYFVCGDNSPQSLDGRLWDKPHPWVAKLDPTVGVVNRDLLIGKAFFVYFPAPYRVGRLPVPDVGKMRMIW